MRNLYDISLRTLVLLLFVTFAELRPRGAKIDKRHTPSGQLIINTAKQALAALHTSNLVNKHDRHARSATSLSSLLPEEPEGTKVVGFDVLLTPTQARIDNLFNSQGHRQKRKAVRFQRFHWPNGVIPYSFHGSVDSISRRAKTVIQSAIRHWEEHTCLKFEPYDPARHGRDHMEFRRGSWCASKLGKVGGRQPLYLAWGCLKRGTIVHEIGHTIGWIHEQARPDRDDFVTIRWNMVANGYKDQYLKHHKVFINTYDVPYDYTSIMHYPSSGEIVTKDKAYQYKIGQREKLSFYDAKLANVMYQCAVRAKCSPRVKCKAPGYVGPKCQCVCPDGTKSCDVNEGSLHTNYLPGDDNTVINRRVTRRRITTTTTTTTRRPTTKRTTTTRKPTTTTTTTTKPTTVEPTTTPVPTTSTTIATTTTTMKPTTTTTIEPTTQPTTTTEGGRHIFVRPSSTTPPSLSFTEGVAVVDDLSTSSVVTSSVSSATSSTQFTTEVTSSEQVTTSTPSIGTTLSTSSVLTSTKLTTPTVTTFPTKTILSTGSAVHPTPSSTTTGHVTPHTMTTVTMSTSDTTKSPLPTTTLSVYWRRKWQPVWRKRWSNKHRKNKKRRRMYKPDRTATTPPVTSTPVTTTTRRYVATWTTPKSGTRPLRVQATRRHSRDKGCWVKIPGFFILGHNDGSMGSATLEECQQKCVKSTLFKCKSFDYWADKKRCYLSSRTRVTVDSRRFTMDHRMVHYQRKPCLKTICPYGWNSVDGRCVKVFTSPTSFKRAEYNCKMRKAGIMAVTQESGRMLRQMSNSGLLPHREFWVVAPKLTRDFWSTIYSFCSHVNIGKRQITLDESFCYKKYAYICEREPL